MVTLDGARRRSVQSSDERVAIRELLEQREVD
jgi:hypothetical protein